MFVSGAAYPRAPTSTAAIAACRPSSCRSRSGPEGRLGIRSNPFSSCADGLDGSGTFNCPHAGFQPVTDRLVDQAGLRTVMGEELGLQFLAVSGNRSSITPAIRVWSC